MRIKSGNPSRSVVKDQPFTIFWRFALGNLIFLFLFLDWRIQQRYNIKMTAPGLSGEKIVKGKEI
jgi:peptidoglycan/LPS O-acetylase OafA/YrhL